ncbi:MAG: response regulator [Proteobacteria bacterium]|nr:response regulator [Pseudomonadota bacterium]
MELTPHCDVDLVSSAEAALSRLAANPDFDLAILRESTDEGRAVPRATELRRKQFDLPILIVSADPENRDLKAALHGKQITDTVQIPWRPGELTRAAERANELGGLRRELDLLRKEMHRRVEDLSAANELTASIADAGSYSELADVVSRGLYRVAPEGISAALLVPNGNAVLHLHCQQPSHRDALRAARDRCIEVFSTLTGHSIGEERLSVDISGERLLIDSDHNAHGVLTHVPVRVEAKIVGVLLVETRIAVAPSEEKQMYFLASRAAETIRRLSAQRDKERRRQALMVEAMADGVVFTDASTEQVLINPSARRMLGLPGDEHVTSAHITERLGFHPRELMGDHSRGAAEVIREEVRLGDRSLHSIISPVNDRAGKLVGVVVVLRDITEAKNLARRQSEFVSVVSHELRTPLTSITGVIDILLSEVAGRMTGRQRRYLEMARESCTQLNGIVDDLLDVARSDSGDQMSVQFEPLVLDEICRYVVKMFRKLAREKGIDLNVSDETHPFRIVGDADRLHQVLSNLLSNAIKFTPEGGEIEVEVFGSSVVKDQVGVSIFNSGEPIPREARERVFAKFEQLEEASTRKVGGAGLGLPIARAIIEAHGGRIWAESLDAGTRFVFTLPVAPSLDGPEEEMTGEFLAGSWPGTAPQGSAPVKSDQSVLIVDRDRHSSFILKGILMAAGYEVLTAVDAEGALLQARSEHPALAVLSTSITEGGASDGGGSDLVQIFAHDPDMRKTAVLVVSSSETDREAATRAGAEEFLRKPFHPAQFLETCNRLIQEAGRIDSRRIMVVDDDPTIRLICREILENAGYAVRDVGDGRSALAEAKRFRPELLLLDIMMPQLDGFRTAELFRADPATSMTPIIFVSAKGETSDKVRAFRAGAEDYVVKPFDAAELVARVDKSLERKVRELGASPTTRLPGADAIEAEIERRLAKPSNDAFCYLDLDNLKAFNDYYGYAKADGVIRQTGGVIRSIIAREGRAGDFIGHIAGDDFVFVTGEDRVTRVCTTICDTFDRLVPLYYNRDDREQGYIETKDRYGILRRFPIMTVSVAAVTLEGNRVKTFTELAAAAAEGKKIAKELVGSSYVQNNQVIKGQRSK